MALPTAWAIGSGRLLLGLILVVASGVPDLLDGALAKAAGRASVRGAFFDSVSDRVTDTIVLGGVAWYLQSRYHGHAAMLAYAVIGVSLLISYERAKAESLGLQAKGGIMERAERIVLLGIGLLFGSILVPVLWVMLGLSLFTAGQRFVKVWRQATALAHRPAQEAAAGRDAGAAAPLAPTGPAPVAGASPVTGAEPVAGVTGGREPGVEPLAGAGVGPGEASRLWRSRESEAASSRRLVARSTGSAGEPIAMADRWRAWREANGWPVRTRSSRTRMGESGLFAFGRRDGASRRWHERRAARLANRARRTEGGEEPESLWPHAGGRGSRRP